MKGYKVNPRIKINHPLADEISIQNSSFHYANDTCSELAFFKNGEWVLDTIPEFKEYEVEARRRYLPKDAKRRKLIYTFVYSLVPNELINDFLDKYRDPIIWKKY